MADKNVPKDIPPHLHQTFKSISKNFDSKSYKKVLKATDVILREVPNQGETLSLKGLTLNAQNKKKEAYELARRGLKHDIKNQRCWHILGLLYRTDRQYFDAAKCFEMAYIYQAQKESKEIKEKDRETPLIVILRDLSVMHIQNRNWDENLKLRHKILMERSKNSQHWFAYVMANHLAGHYTKAVEVLDKYCEARLSGKEDRFEESELLFYRNMILEESGEIQVALDHLESVKDQITDKEDLKSKRAHYLGLLGRGDEAAEQWKELISRNPENVQYHEGLLRVLGFIPPQGILWDSYHLEPSQTQKVLNLYTTLSKQNPQAKLVKQVPLNFTTGDAFKELLRKFFYPHFTKGVPTLFGLVKYLYRDKEKVKLISEVIQEIETNLHTLNKLHPSETLEEPPSALLFTYFYLANHYNLLHQTTLALDYVQKCILHTPTVLDFEVLRARIYKDASNPSLAAKHMEEARSYDLADRYLNTKATRYFLRANLIKQAEDTITQITRTEERSPSHSSIIFDMQVMWYEREEGMCYLRQKEYGKALKKFVDIDKHFLDFFHDQVDFHSFCLRKMTLRQNIKFLRFEDTIWSHQLYYKAATKIVQIYLHEYTSPTKGGAQVSEEHLAGMTEEELKKYRSKQKREAARKQKEQLQLKEKVENVNINKPDKDLDPNGEKLLTVVDPLGEANRYLQYLLTYSPNKLKVHLLGFEVAMHKKKFLLALKAIKRGKALSPSNPLLHTCIVRFFHTVSSAENLHAITKKVISVETREILGDTPSLKDYNEKYLTTHGGVAGRLAYVVSALLLDQTKKNSLLHLLMDTTDDGYPLKECIKVHSYLESVYPASAAAYKEKCQKLFPYTSYFETPSTTPDPTSTGPQK